METRRVVHPSADVLKAFGLGKLDDSSAGVLMDHLDQCADCCKMVVSQSGDDFLNRLRQVHGHNSTVPPANALSESVADLKPPQPKSPSPQTAIPNLPPELASNPQYEILRELGRGGMGVVYLAKNKLMDRLEVLKVVNKALLDRPGAVERFLREIRSAAKLSHANVVGAYSAVQVGDLLAFAMEYVEGQDLTAVVKAQGPLPVSHACYYVQQAALGLQHAFEKNMVHRDIKPQNLILAREGKKHIVKVLDFGLAKVMREKAEDTGLTGDGKMLGTPDYIAPEQTLDAASADIRADIYSLGCTLYYLLSGHPPFSAASLGAILLAHQMQEAKLLNVVRSEVPEELAAVVRKMMAKERAKRYQTPLEVAQALAVFVKPGVKGGTTPKSSPDLSLGTPKMAGVKAAKADGPAALPAASAKPTPPEREATGDDAWSTSVMERGIASRPPRRSGAVRQRRPPAAVPAAGKKWWIGGGVAAGVLLIALVGMWAGGVFKVKTKDGTLVLENLPANAEVVVDDETVTLKANDGKPVEIRVAAGKKHRIQVKKGGFKVFGEEIEIDVGGRKSVLVRLESNDQSPPPDAAWLKEVAALPVHKQADAVAAKLKELNPGFDGKIEYKVEGGQVVSLEFSTVSVKTISPVRALPELQVLLCNGTWWANNGQLADLTPLKGMKLTGLECHDTQVADLSPLRGMPLTYLGCWNTKVSDLSPLKDMNLTSLHCDNTKVSDLSPLKDMKLTDLVCPGTQVSDLSPLKDMRLTHLRCENTRVSDLSPLKDMRLRILNCAGTQVSDLSPLKDMKLTVLWYDNTAISDLLPLKGMPLKEVHCDFKPERDAEILRSIKTLEKINDKPAARFWKELPPDKPDGQGFVPLFNGKDLSGWSVDGGPPGQWSVEGNTIVGQSKHFSTRNYLLIDKDYADFILRFDFKVADGSHGGVGIRAIEGEKMPLNNALLFDHPLIKLTNPAKDEKEPTGTTHWLKSAATYVRPLEVLPLPAGTWHSMEVVVRGNNCTATIGGKKLVNVTLDPDARNNKAIVPGLGRRKGKVGFQINTGVLRFRKIEIKELPATKSDAPAAPNAATEEKGFVPLFNGKDLTGWKTHPKQPGNWRVMKGTGGGVLTGSGPAVSHLYSERGDYKDFHLRVEARINDGGNSGVYCRSAFGPQIPANNPWLAHGYEAQINSTHRDVNKTGSLYGGSEGALVSIREAPVPPEKWFAMEVIVEGKRIIVKVNGETTADYTDDKRLFTSGHIALQQHDPKTVVEFRKIEIKELPPAKSENSASANAEPAKSPPPGGESALPPEAKTAAKAFEKASADAREKLLAEFDTALERLAKSTGSTEQRLKLIDAVKEEKKRFESKGLIPFSEPMRPFVAKYFASTSDAESKVHRAYNALIDAQLRAKNENMVADLRADLGNLLVVRVLARWRHFGDGKPQDIHAFYSNGRIDNINGNATWIYAKGVLIYRWPAANAPGGAWIGTLHVSADGTTYAGTTNDRNRPKVRGVYVKDD